MDIFRQQTQEGGNAPLVEKLVRIAKRGDIWPKLVGHIGDLSRSSRHQSDRLVPITMPNYLTELPMRTQTMMTTTTSLFSSHSNNSLSYSKTARSLRWKSL